MESKIFDLVKRIKGLRRLSSAAIQYSEYLSESLDKDISYKDYLSDLSDSYGSDVISYSSYLSEKLPNDSK